MIKYIDVDASKEKITKFVYTNRDGDMEGVQKCEDCSRIIEIFETGGSDMTIFIKDIPKLITALQCAQDEWGG